MTTSNHHPVPAAAAASRRDAARRRVRMATMGIATVTIGASSLGAVALAQGTAVDGPSSVVDRRTAEASNVSGGVGQAPVASSGGS